MEAANPNGGGLISGPYTGKTFGGAGSQGIGTPAGQLASPNQPSGFGQPIGSGFGGLAALLARGEGVTRVKVWDWMERGGEQSGSSVYIGSKSSPQRRVKVVAIHRLPLHRAKPQRVPNPAPALRR